MSSLDRQLSAGRQLLPQEHQLLREYMRPFNHTLGVSVKWRRLGEVSVTYLERGIYQRAQKTCGHLAAVSAVDIARDITTTLIPRMSTAREQLTAEVINIDFFGNGRFQSIAYIIECSQMDDERRELTEWLDEKNGVNNDWGDFVPHLSIATIDSVNTSENVLKKFWDISPRCVTLQPLAINAT